MTKSGAAPSEAGIVLAFGMTSLLKGDGPAWRGTPPVASFAFAAKGGNSMITALVQFTLPQPITRESARETFSATAPKYRGIPGLIRKYYVLSADGGTAGGVYLWKCREDAERLYTDEWRAFIRDKYGAEPSVTYFESPVVVDNALGTIVIDG